MALGATYRTHEAEGSAERGRIGRPLSPDLARPSAASGPRGQRSPYVMEKRIAATNGQPVPVTADQPELDGSIEAQDRAEETFEARIIQVDATAFEQLLRKAGL